MHISDFTTELKVSQRTSSWMIQTSCGRSSRWPEEGLRSPTRNQTEVFTVEKPLTPKLEKEHQEHILCVLHGGALWICRPEVDCQATDSSVTSWDVWRVTNGAWSVYITGLTRECFKCCRSTGSSGTRSWDQQGWQSDRNQIWIFLITPHMVIN